MKDQALHPQFIPSSLPSLAKDKVAEKAGATKEERLLNSMSITGGWRVLTELIDELLDDLDNVNRQAIEAGADFEEVGKNTFVVSMTKEIIRMMLNKVEDARESCENDKTK